jgi:hypothetical protein
MTLCCEKQALNEGASEAEERNPHRRGCAPGKPQPAPTGPWLAGRELNAPVKQHQSHNQIGPLPSESLGMKTGHGVRYDNG